MKTTRSVRIILLICLATVTCAAAQPSGRPGPWRLFGDWQVKVQFGERQMDAIIAFSRDSESNLTAQWIGAWGVTDLKDVKFEENKLSFVQTVQFRENEFTSTFTGAIEEGKLTGTLSSDRGESKVEGQRAPRIPRAVGDWEVKFRIGERDVTTTLALRANKEGQLTGEWQSQWGEHKITDLAYERGNLTFKRNSKFQDREMESTFEGTLRGNELSGVMKSERGEIQVEGSRVNAALIGTWNLEVVSERGPRKQRLRVNPDMTGLYGTVPVKKVNVKDGKVDFLMVRQFGDQTMEMTFAGKLAESKLTGELTTSRGTRKITGTKVVRPSRRRRNM